MKYVVYSDESCHLEYDNSPVMVLEAMYSAPSNLPQVVANSEGSIFPQLVGKLD